MPDNPSSASSYANSIDPAGGIQQPHAKPELSGHSRPIEVKDDFNAGLPITADQKKAQESQTVPSEQVAKTNLGLNEGPKMTGPFGEVIARGAHNDAKANDGARVIAALHVANRGRAKQKTKGKSVVSDQTLAKLKLLNSRGALKNEFNDRIQEARADQRLSQGRRQGRSI